MRPVWDGAVAIARVMPRVSVGLTFAAGALAVLVATTPVVLSVVSAHLVADNVGVHGSKLPDSTVWFVLCIAILGLVLVAPFAEELVFRGLGFATLGRYALPLTAALFALAHGLPVLLIPVAIAGLALGWVRQKSGSVLPGMGVHMSLNALALALALLVS